MATSDTHFHRFYFAKIVYINVATERRGGGGAYAYAEREREPELA